MKQINHLWRIFATGLCFCVFGLGGVLLTLIVFPIQKILYKNINQRNELARRTVHKTFKWFLRFIEFSGVFNINLEGIKDLKKLNGHLILANHPSLIDVVMLISVIPNADCVVKAHLFSNPFIRGVVKNTGYISNADPEGLLQDCQSSLQAGNNLIIFPEGTRTKPGQTLKFQRGAANIALRCQAKITNILITVCPTTLTKSEPWYKVPQYKSQFSAKLIPNTVPLPNVQADNISKQVRQYNSDLESYFNEIVRKK